MDFRQRSISTVVKTELYASRGTFWGTICFPKENQFEKGFVLWAEFFFSFIEFVLPVYQKRVPVCWWTFRDKSFFRTKISLWIFSEITRKIDVLLQRVFYRLTKLRFICLEEFFGRIPFSEKNIKSSITFFRNRGEFFFRDLGRKQALGRKASARLPKLESTLPKSFRKKTYFFEEISVLKLFFRPLADFYRTLAKNIKRLSNCFFNCREQLLLVKFFFLEN